MTTPFEQACEKMPDALGIKFFEIVNELFHECGTAEKPLSQLEIAEVMYRSIATVMATFIKNHVDAPIRDYVASRLIYNLAGMLCTVIPTWEDTKSTPPVVDNIEPV